MRLIIIFLSMGIFASTLQAQLHLGKKPSVRLRVASDRVVAIPGERVNLVLEMHHPEGWNTFWTNPGTGMPTTLQWKVPQGYKVEETLWPTPEVQVTDWGTSHIYRGKIYAVTPLRIPESAAKEDVMIELRAEWLECDESGCIPRTEKLPLQFTVGDLPSPNPGIVPEVEDVLSQQPRKLDEWEIKSSDSADYLELHLQPLSGANPDPRDIYFFESSATPVLEYEMPEISRDPSGWEVRMKKGGNELDGLEGFLYASNGWTTSGTIKNLLVNLPFNSAKKIAARSLETRQPIDEYGIQWIRWSPQKVQELRAEGRAIFVEYTALWDLTPIINRKRIFEASDSGKLKAKLKDLNVAMVTADFTNMDPEIRKDLERFNRQNIPAYLFYPSDSQKAPFFLPELLTKDDLLAALKAEEPRTSKMAIYWVPIAVLVLGAATLIWIRFNFRRRSVPFLF